MALAAVAYAKAMRGRRIMIATSSIGPGSTNMVTAAAVAHANRLPVLLLSGDTFQHRIVDPVLQQVEHFGDPTITVDRHIQAGEPLLGPDHQARPDRPLAPAGPRRDARPGDPRPGVLRAAPGRPGRGVRLPGPLLRAEGPLHPPARAPTRATSRRPRPCIGARRATAASSPAAASTTRARSTRCAPSPSATAIPVVETVAGKSTLTHDHPNYAGPIGVTGSAAANAVAEQADVVIAVGTRLQDFTTGSWSVFRDPDVRFVAVNTASLGRPQAGRPAGDRRREGLARGDRRGTRDVRGTAGVAGDGRRADRRVARLSRLVVRAAARRPAGLRRGHPGDQCAPPTRTDYILSAAGGLPGELSMGWRSKSVGSFDSEYGYSTMGYEIAGAWGARLARPTRRRHRLGRRRLVPDDELGHLLDGDDRPEGHLHGLRQRRLRGHQPAAGQHRRRGVQQPAASTTARALFAGRLREARRIDGRDRRAGRGHRRPAGRVRPGQGGRPELRHRHPGRPVHLDRGWRLVGGRRARGQRAARGPRGARGLGGEQEHQRVGV